ncbi:hypothetical protein CBL_02754 [Carabus blaptoides fortunei]
MDSAMNGEFLFTICEFQNKLYVKVFGIGKLRSNPCDEKQNIYYIFYMIGKCLIPMWFLLPQTRYTNMYLSWYRIELIDRTKAAVAFDGNSTRVPKRDLGNKIDTNTRSATLEDRFKEDPSG